MQAVASLGSARRAAAPHTPAVGHVTSRSEPAAPPRPAAQASRRLLAVLLREIDGFEAGPSVVVGATNRKVDLDPALLSRWVP